MRLSYSSISTYETCPAKYRYQYEDRVLIGEIYLPIGKLVAYYGRDLGGAHLPFNFQLLESEWDAAELYAMINEYEGALPLGGWPNWVLGNHDKPRIASRVGAAQARVAAMLLLTLRGTPTIYYGDELGMHDVAIPPEMVQDPQGRNMPELGLSRDPHRTPMQWDASANAGFTEGEPWLPIAGDFAAANVDAQLADPRSILTLYRRLLELRRREPALSIGDFLAVPTTGDLLSYRSNLTAPGKLLSYWV
jgi:alpha-glucosidase